MLFGRKVSTVLSQRGSQCVGHFGSSSDKVVPFVWITGVVVEFFRPIVVPNVTVALGPNGVIARTETGDRGMHPAFEFRIIKQWGQALPLLRWIGRQSIERQQRRENVDQFSRL